MDWKLKFISQENFVKHVEATIDKYGEKLESFDIKRFNKNIIDPIFQVFQVLRQAKNGHYFGSGRNVMHRIQAISIGYGSF